MVYSGRPVLISTTVMTRVGMTKGVRHKISKTFIRGVDRILKGQGRIDKKRAKNFMRTP